MAGKTLSELAAVVDSLDDCLLLLSYTTNNGQSYSTTRIRVADFFDDIIHPATTGSSSSLAMDDGGTACTVAWNHGFSDGGHAGTTLWNQGLPFGAIQETDIFLVEDTTLGTNKNGLSVGDVEIADGVTVTVADASDWHVINGQRPQGVIAEMLTAINSDHAISHHSNGLSFDDVSIGGSATVTIPSSSTWRIL